MQRLIESTLRSVGPQMVKAPAEIAIGLLDRRAPVMADRLRMALASSHFNAGDYRSARDCFDAVSASRFALKAHLMVDWIDFKFGEVGRGWPRYPGADFDSDQHTPAFAPEGAKIIIEKPLQPVQLVTELGLKRWHPGLPTPHPVLVWFNFKASLGGELLCAKIVKRLEQKYGIPMILAGDARLADVLRANFPLSEVIDKAANLAGISGRCDSFILARDALALVVGNEADLEPIGAFSLHIPKAGQKITGRRPHAAISWKTTNPTQGRYRNIPVNALAAVLARFDIDFHSAQHGLENSERRILVDMLGKRISFDTIDTRASVGELASTLSSMDRVITIDNSVLHICGAFGIPATGLISVPSYWAWPIEETRSRWYDSVTLIHQKHAGDWSNVFVELARTYDDLLARSGLPSPVA